MNKIKALRKIREDLQRFPLDNEPRPAHRRMLIPGEPSELLVHALQYLCKTLKIERAAVFLLNESAQSLQAQQVVERGEVMAGEEEIALLPGSPLTRLLAGKREHLILKDPPATVFVPLRAFGNVFGVLRVESRPPLSLRRTARRGLVAGHRLPTGPTAHLPLLQDFARDLATVLRGMEIAAAERYQVAQMQALHEVSNAIFRSLRLDEMLDSVAQSLIRQMGFDRIKIYLINKEGDALENVLTLDQTQQKKRDKEQYPLKRGAHPMVDLILGKTGDERIEKYQRTISYIPLRARDENLGVLMVDNLLSQQEIYPEQIPVLTAIAGQMSMAIKNARLFQGVEELSITDGLTGLYLLRYFKQRLKEEFYRAERTHGQLSMMILDIDHFKRFNDTYGHPSGDTVLAAVAERVLANARKIDLTARYGGDEFIILLPDTSPEEAMLLADRLHEAISQETVALPDGKVAHINVSIGVATYPTHAANIEELIKRSDEALYWIKSHGRNRICLYSSELQSKIRTPF